jgi:pyocin large subunit-like protein
LYITTPLGFITTERGLVSMATKGASFRYGNSNNGRQGKPTTHINYGWAKDFNKHTLYDHYRRHGSQVGCTSKESYAAHAVSFANTVDRKNCVSFIDKNGSTYKYNKTTNTLAIITENGYVVTYFKPSAGYEYYKNEKKRKGRKR